MRHSTLFKDLDGNTSSKRVAAFIALTCMVAGFLASLTGLGHVLPEWMFDGFLYITGGGLGLAATERFAPKGS